MGGCQKNAPHDVKKFFLTPFLDRIESPKRSDLAFAAAAVSTCAEAPQAAAAMRGFRQLIPIGYGVPHG